MTLLSYADTIHYLMNHQRRDARLREAGHEISSPEQCMNLALYTLHTYEPEWHSGEDDWMWPAHSCHASNDRWLRYDWSTNEEAYL